MWTKTKAFLKRFFHRWRLIRYGIYFLILLLLFIFRAPILRGLGNWLIEEDTLQKADIIVQLGGNPFERAVKVEELFKKGYAPLIVTTGSNQSVALQALDIHLTEAENSKQGLIHRGVTDSLIYTLNQGTSTLEEAKALKKFALEKRYKKIILVTAKFHTARVHKYFNREFEGSGITIMVCGAKPLKYQTSTWWKSEEGLLMVFNEYVKSVYYWWNY